MVTIVFHHINVISLIIQNVVLVCRWQSKYKGIAHHKMKNILNIIELLDI